MSPGIFGVDDICVRNSDLIFITVLHSNKYILTPSFMSTKEIENVIVYII